MRIGRTISRPRYRHAIGRTPPPPLWDPPANDQIRIIAVIAARNAGTIIAATLESLRRQARPVDLTVVVPYDCVDNTAEVAEAAGAYVIPYPGAAGSRVDALNYGISRLEPYLTEEDILLILDADTVLSPGFLACGEEHLRPGTGAVAARATGHDDDSVLGHLQRMQSYRRSRTRRVTGRAFTLAEPGRLIWWRALREVREARRRGLRVPAGSSFYEPRSASADNEMLLALQSLGYAVAAPKGLHVDADVTDRPATLLRQRQRGYRSELRDLRRYGRRLPPRMRRRYRWGQARSLAGSAATFAYAIAAAVTSATALVPWWWWLVPALPLLATRVVGVWRLGWKARLLAVAFFPEQFHQLLLAVAYLRARAEVAVNRASTARTTPPPAARPMPAR